MYIAPLVRCGHSSCPHCGVSVEFMDAASNFRIDGNFLLSATRLCSDCSSRETV